MSRGRIALLACCLASLPACGAVKPPVRWTITSAPKTVKAGSRFQLTVHGEIEPGWHLYALQEPEGGPAATEISLADQAEVDLLRVAQSRPRTVADPVFQARTSFFVENADFTLYLQMQRAAVTGPLSMRVLVRYQSCNDRMCLPPHTDTVDVPLVLAR